MQRSEIPMGRIKQVGYTQTVAVINGILLTIPRRQMIPITAKRFSGTRFDIAFSVSKRE